MSDLRWSVSRSLQGEGGAALPSGLLAALRPASPENELQAVLPINVVWTADHCGLLLTFSTCLTPWLHSLNEQRVEYVSLWQFNNSCSHPSVTRIWHHCLAEISPSSCCGCMVFHSCVLAVQNLIWWKFLLYVAGTQMSSACQLFKILYFFFSIKSFSILFQWAKHKLQATKVSSYVAFLHLVYYAFSYVCVYFFLFSSYIRTCIVDSALENNLWCFPLNYSVQIFFCFF